MTEHTYHIATTGFEAARRVSILPDGHPGRRLHGHSFLARARAEIGEGWAEYPGGEMARLKTLLDACVAPLDYNDLNALLPIPTDEDLARWVRHRLDVPGLESVGVQSTQNQGADLDENGDAHIWRRFRFEAAHQLPRVRPGHQCGRLHGHGFEVILHAKQALGDRDMGVDFDHLADIWSPFQQTLHHSCLNDIPGLDNPTSELLASWLWGRLKPLLPELSWVTVYETDSAGCHYDGQNYRIWKEFKFESALRTSQAAADSQHRRLYGHSYLLRLHLTAALDEVMGWTVDYGDVKEKFKPVYDLLDHRLLNDLPDIADTSPASVVRWIARQTSPRLPPLDRIDLYETPHCGVQLCWGGHPPALPS